MSNTTNSGSTGFFGSLYNSGKQVVGSIGDYLGNTAKGVASWVSNAFAQGPVPYGSQARYNQNAMPPRINQPVIGNPNGSNQFQSASYGGTNTATLTSSKTHELMLIGGAALAVGVVVYMIKG